MRKYSLIILFIAFTGWIVSCEKNSYHVTQREEVTNKALLKIGYFVPSIQNPGAQVKANGVRISNLLVYNTPFPGGGLNTLGSSNSDFLQLNPGSTPLTVTIPKSGTDEDSVKLFEGSFDFQQKRQTLFFTDTLPNVTGVLVDDETAAPVDSGKARIKFVHLVPNVANVDLYRNTTLLKGNIAYKGVSEYFDVFAGNASYIVKTAGVNDTVAIQSINPTAGRIYTIFSRGFKGGASAISPKVSAVIIQ